MSKILRGKNKLQLEAKIYQSLGLDKNDQTEKPQRRVADRAFDQETQEISRDLDKILKKSQKKKQLIRQQLSRNKLDISEEMSTLKWRIDCLRKYHIGKQQNRKHSTEMTFDQLYQIQKKKYAELRERRKIKLNDAKYLDMIGNMQLRNEKRKLSRFNRIDDQLSLLDQAIQNQ